MPVAFGYRQVNNTRGVTRCQRLMLDPASAVDVVRPVLILVTRRRLGLPTTVDRSITPGYPGSNLYGRRCLGEEVADERSD